MIHQLEARFHGLMPYTQGYSNPIAMIRGMMDLFMAQPFGGKSLLQRCAHTYNSPYP
jgi:hypothetical protein